MTVTIEIKGLEPVISRFTRFKSVLHREMRATMNDSLNVIHENIPQYPPPPAGSRYVRTFKLAKSVGLGGQPDIKRVMGSGTAIQGEYGARLGYATYVIGERQAWMHKGRWWRLPVEVFNKVKSPIFKLWDDMMEDLARFLDGKGL